MYYSITIFVFICERAGTLTEIMNSKQSKLFLLKLRFIYFSESFAHFFFFVNFFRLNVACKYFPLTIKPCTYIVVTVSSRFGHCMHNCMTRNNYFKHVKLGLVLIGDLSSKSYLIVKKDGTLRVIEVLDNFAILTIKWLRNYSQTCIKRPCITRSVVKVPKIYPLDYSKCDLF